MLAHHQSIKKVLRKVEQGLIPLRATLDPQLPAFLKPLHHVHKIRFNQQVSLFTYTALIHCVTTCILCILIFLIRPWPIIPDSPWLPGTCRFFPHLLRTARPKLADLESFWYKLYINNTNMVSLNLQIAEHCDMLASVLDASYPLNQFIQLGEKLLGTFYGSPFVYVPLQKYIQCLDISTL